MLGSSIVTFTVKLKLSFWSIFARSFPKLFKYWFINRAMIINCWINGVMNTFVIIYNFRHVCYAQVKTARKKNGFLRYNKNYNQIVGNIGISLYNFLGQSKNFLNTSLFIYLFKVNFHTMQKSVNWFALLQMIRRMI